MSIETLQILLCGIKLGIFCPHVKFVLQPSVEKDVKHEISVIGNNISRLTIYSDDK